MLSHVKPVSDSSVSDLRAEIVRLHKIIEALMDHAEGVSGIKQSDFNLFQATITLQEQVRCRTIELEKTLWENQQITRALSESEYRNRILVENSPLCIHEIDLDGCIVSMNPVGVKMMGFESQQYESGGKYLDVVHEVDRKRIGNLLARAYGGEASDFEFKASSPEGRVFKSCFVPIKNRGGYIEKLMGIMEDITERKLAEEKLAAREREFRTLAENFPDYIARYDCEGRLVYANPAVERSLGCPYQALVGKKAEEFIAHDAFLKQRDMLLAVAATGKEVRFEEVIPLEGGGSVVYLTHIVAEFGSDGKPVGVLAVARDISEIRRAQDRLRITASVFDNSREGIIIADAGGKIIDVNRGFSRITGYNREEVIGKNPSLLSSGRQDKTFYKDMWRSLLQEGYWQGQIWNRHKSGEIYAELLSVSVIRDNEGQVQNFVALFSDISHIKSHEAELIRVANHDALTGLPNRRLLSDRLDQTIARAPRSGRLFAVCYLDLDGFKQVNDWYGHEVGDQLLVEIAHRLRQVLRAEDTLSRMGGDEFVLLLDELVCEQSCRQVLERALDVVSKPVVIGSDSVVVSASIGVAFCSPDNDGTESLLRHADQAMYMAKQGGKNQYRFYGVKQECQADRP